MTFLRLPPRFGSFSFSAHYSRFLLPLHKLFVCRHDYCIAEAFRFFLLTTSRIHSCERFTQRSPKNLGFLDSRELLLVSSFIAYVEKFGWQSLHVYRSLTHQAFRPTKDVLTYIGLTIKPKFLPWKIGTSPQKVTFLMSVRDPGGPLYSMRL